MGRELQSTEDGLLVPHEFQLLLLRRGHLQDDVVLVDGAGIRRDAGPGFTVVRIGELGVPSGPRLHHDFMAIGHQQSDGIGIERDPTLLQDDFLGNANAEGLLPGGNSQQLFLGRKGGLEGEAAYAFLGFHGRS